MISQERLTPVVRILSDLRFHNIANIENKRSTPVYRVRAESGLVAVPCRVG